MERSRGIESLRNRGMINQNELSCIEDIHIPIGSTITNLVNISPQERPTASELLNSIFTETNIEKTKSVEEIKLLNNRIIVQELKIQNQEAIIIQQQNEINSLKEILNSK